MAIIRGDDSDNRELFGFSDEDDLIFGYDGNDLLDGLEGRDELYGGAGRDGLYGGDHHDVLYGDDGNDELNGGADGDKMYGGLGNDTYYVDHLEDLLIEDDYYYFERDIGGGERYPALEWAAGGIDTVVSSISFSLDRLSVHAANLLVIGDFENLILAGTDPLDGYGNALDNEITGNSGDNSLWGYDGHDTLDGGAGADELEGGAGNDTYVVDSGGDVVTEAADEGTDMVRASIGYTLTDHVENLTLTGSAAIDGVGNGLNNVIRGNSGVNMLAGHGGDDTYYIGTGDMITELAGEGIDKVFISSTHTLGANLEYLTLTGSASVNGTGNALNNGLIGNTGNNTLDGLAGADRMEGGRGDDTYYVDNAGDVVLEEAGPLTGTDTVRSSVSHTLAANVENLTLIGNGAASGTGNALNNILTGNTFANKLNGGVGHDELVGGGGSDTLTGGLDPDVFRFNAPTDGGASGDTIADFRIGADLIVLDHNGFELGGTGTLSSEDVDVDFIVGNIAVSGNPTLIYNAFVDELWWDGDGTGGGAAQRLAKVPLPGLAFLTESDFLIV
jgi:Ca2+-binding RTX toxin-like protein